MMPGTVNRPNVTSAWFDAAFLGHRVGVIPKFIAVDFFRMKRGAAGIAFATGDPQSRDEQVLHAILAISDSSEETIVNQMAVPANVAEL